MYQLEWVQKRIAARRRAPAADPAPTTITVSRTVWLLGLTSLLTDVSSEMVNGVLPLYVVGFLRLSPVQFGLIDGLYQGVSAILRLAGGLIADRIVFLDGYGLMGVVYVSLIYPQAGTLGAIAAVVGLGAYYAATDGVLMAIAGRLLPADVCATGLAVLATCTSLARLASSLAFGYLWTTSQVAVAVFGSALVVALVVAAIALTRVKAQY